MDRRSETSPLLPSAGPSNVKQEAVASISNSPHQNKHQHSLEKQALSSTYSTFTSGQPEGRHLDAPVGKSNRSRSGVDGDGGGGGGGGTTNSSTISAHRYRPSVLLTCILCIIIMVAIACYFAATALLRFLDHASGSPQKQRPLPTDPFGSIIGPLISQNFPDPAIIHDNGVSYAFATNNRAFGDPWRHVQMAKSTDNLTWTLLPEDALPFVGAWQTGARVWAPDVVRVADGTFVLYYTDEPTWSPAHHCLGVATSDRVTGPYKPLDQPWACPDVDLVGGAIDPDGFLDTGTNRRYVAYKIDGNSIGHGGSCNNDVPPLIPTPIMLQEVADDGITKVGEPVQILDRGEQDGPLIEAPALFRSDEGVYFLFFSSNCFTTPLYDISYATALNITGPYRRASRPLLISGDGPNLIGPGGLDIIENGNMVVFHGHITGENSPHLARDARDARDGGRGRASGKRGKPIIDIRMPLVRGLYAGEAVFSGRKCTLAGT